jgi:hypothetical protein
MQFSKIIGLAAFTAAATATSLSYDEGYDNGDRSLLEVSCSDGANGLITRYGWNYQKDIPTFPYIGGVPAVAGWNSPSCGTCWKVTYGAKSIYVLGIDQGSGGFNIALAAMQDLTNGQAVQLGRIDVASEQVAVSNCKL